MLTSRDAEQDIVQALNSGADDYVSKPFRPNELKARVAAVLRRHGERVPRSMRCRLSTTSASTMPS